MIFITIISGCEQFSKNARRLEIAATPTPLTPLQEEGGQKLRELLFNQVRLRGLIQPAEASFVCVAPDFQSVGDLQIRDAPSRNRINKDRLRGLRN